MTMNRQTHLQNDADECGAGSAWKRGMVRPPSAGRWTPLHSWHCCAFAKKRQMTKHHLVFVQRGPKAACQLQFIPAMNLLALVLTIVILLVLEV